MRTLHAGPLRVLYDVGFPRRISYGEKEIIRMIYFALRDHNWNTISTRIENERVEAEADRFQITYDCLNFDASTTIIAWKVKIEGRPDGSVIFEISGEVKAPFRRNRAGFCVLHPLNVLEEECMITHPDGTKTTRPFPRDVAADNPFQDIQQMQWSARGIPCTISFEGDLFETEDQRNWGDATFKTFCTPLSRPFPVDLQKGDRIFQRINFRLDTELTRTAERVEEITLIDAGHRSKLPFFGICQSTESDQLPDKAVSLLRALRFQHYRIDLAPSLQNFVIDFSSACEKAFAAGIALEVALHLTQNFEEELEAFTVICRQNKVRLRKVLLLPVNGMVTAQQAIERLEAIKPLLPRALFGVGTNYNFNEINKNHFSAASADYISFSMDPQEHAFDDLTVLENSATPEHLIRSAQSIYGKEMPIHISPLTMRKRFNPYAMNPDDLYIDEAAKADPRMKSPFAAVWSFASILSVAKGGGSAITFFQTVGNQGIMSLDGEPYPVYELLKAVSMYQGKGVVLLESSDPLAIVGVILDGRLLAIANLSDEDKIVRWNESVFQLKPTEITFQVLDRPK